ncbi:hypothetical protein IIA95_04260 [Patescibacteria group bacterium]|nr:hypothetical protein [Patescibacteria group bacterium]
MASSSADVLEPSNTATSTPAEEILPVATSSPEAAGLDNGEVATSTDEILNLEDISVDENISTTTQESISEEVLISDEENISIEENTATTTTES